MRFLTSARYGAMGLVGRFFARFPGLRLNDRVILRSDRGVEVGDIISRPAPMMAETPDPEGLGEILRKATREDETKLDQIEQTSEPKELAFCEKRIAELKLPMRLADVEHLFGGTKVIFYFLADGRVDFRELVRDLAREYQTRIEMRQIGVRDEARLLAYYEHCGRELCCRTFMKNLEPVTMRMAKNQKATLDPTKISGRCGRLMCCLRYEDKTYDELKQNMPKKGARVLTEKGTGEVLSHDILSQTVKIEISPGKEVIVSLDQIQKELPPEAEVGPAAPDDAEGRGREPRPPRRERSEAAPGFERRRRSEGDRGDRGGRPYRPDADPGPRGNRSSDPARPRAPEGADKPGPPDVEKS